MSESAQKPSAPFIPVAHRDLVFVDFETTGLDPSAGHEIIDLAAVRVRSDFSREIGSVSRLCLPQRLDIASPEALEVNKYDPREWAREGVHIRVALVEFSALLGDDPFNTIVWVGHNPSFDRGFSDVSFKREKLAVPNTKYLIDTASLAWPLVVKGIIDKMNLESICSRYGVSNQGSHRAMTDVRRTISVYKRMLGFERAT